MKIEFQAERGRPEEWRRIADLRLRSLEESPQWFSGDFSIENLRTKEEWQELISKIHWVIYSHRGVDLGLMTVEKSEPIRGTDCWLGGCWVDPRFRGSGITGKMIAELDQICVEEGWYSQGLGVWPENSIAIRAYTRHGFAKSGDPQPSRSKPNQLYQKMVRFLPL